MVHAFMNYCKREEERVVEAYKKKEGLGRNEKHFIWWQKEHHFLFK
jgi:hypothetical protein